MTLVGCDLHSRKQQVAVLVTDTGEVLEQELLHEGDAVERFYRALPRPVTVGIEATGYTLWFHAVMQKLGHTLLVGEAAKIRAMVVRKTKTDRRDAQHLLDLLKHERFPTVWMPDPTTRDLRALIAHRVRLVRMRTMVKNGLHAIALNQRVALGPSLWTKRGLAQLQALSLPPHTANRRADSLELLTWLTTHIDQLDAQIAEAAAADARAQRLLTHPGVGPLTALITVLALGPAARFPTSKHVVSYVGLAPAIHSSADKYTSARSPSKATRFSAGSWDRRPRSLRGPMASSGVPTSPCCIGGAAPRQRSPWLANCSFASTSCFGTRSTTRSSGAAAACGALASQLIPSPRPPCSRRADGPRVPRADVPVRAFSG